MGACRSNLVDHRISNLAINARNAMPSGGELAITAANATVDEETALRIGWGYQQATDWHGRRPPGVISG